MNQKSELPKIIIGIPGRWANQSEVVQAIGLRSGGYLFAGMVLMHIETRWSCSVEVYEYDPNMRSAFEIASGGKMTDAELDEVEAHLHTVYLIGDGGSYQNARHMIQAAKALIRCGGIAVKIESAGVAHSASDWAKLTDEELPLSELKAFVTFVGGNGNCYSCGMHNLGYPDAAVTADISPQEAASLLHQFLCYINFENPSISDHQTFSVEENAPLYRLVKTPCTMFPEDDPFHNPYGVWQLSAVSL